MNILLATYLNCSKSDSDITFVAMADRLRENVVTQPKNGQKCLLTAGRRQQADSNDCGSVSH